MTHSHDRRGRRSRTAIPVALAAAACLALASPGTNHRASAAGPLVSAPIVVDHPAGIAFSGPSTLAVAASGTGTLSSFTQSGATLVPTPLIHGLVPGAFDRGLTGVAVDGNGNVYVAETEDGAVYFSSPDGSTTGVYARGLGSPNGIAFAPDGTLYVADQAGHRVLAVAPNRSISVAASGFAAPPFGLAFAPDGSLFVSTDRDGMIYRVVLGSAPVLYKAISTAAAGGTPSAEGLVFDSAGDLIVGCGATGHILEIVKPGNPGPPLLPPTDGTYDIGSSMVGPLNLAFPPDGTPTLFVATQAEGAGNRSNQVTTLPVLDHGGNALTAPLLTPTALPQAPPHGVAFTAGGTSVDPATFLDQLPQGLATDVGHAAAEPKIEVTNAGNVYMDTATFANSPCQAFPHTNIRESTDGGQTWVDSSPPVPTGTSNPPCSLDPYEYYDRTTNRFFDADLVGPCTYVEYTDDDTKPTKAWTTSPVCGPGALDDHQTISSGPPVAGELLAGSYATATYYCYQTVATAACSRSLDGGATWVPLPNAAYSQADTVCGNVVAAGNGEQTGHVVVGRDGTVYLPKANCLSGPVVAISKDGGLNWTQVLVHAEPTTPDHEASVAVDAAGTVYYDWVGADLLPHLSISHDDGATWSTPIQIGPPGLTEADQPALNAGDGGKIVAYFMGTESDCCYGRGTDGTQTTSDTAASQPSMWNAYAVISLNATAAAPTFTATSLNDPLHPLLRGNCGPGRCDVTYDYLDTYIDNGGRTWTAIANECTGPCATTGLAGANSADAEGFAGQLICGPKLIGTGALSPPAFAAAQARCGSAVPIIQTPESPAGTAALAGAAGLVGLAVALGARRRRRVGAAAG